MASTQRQTRRTGAMVDYEMDDTPPAKRQRTEMAAPRAAGKQANGRKSIAQARLNNRVYDQTEDDFRFTRKDNKKAPSPSTNISLEDSAPKKGINKPAVQSRAHKRTSRSAGQSEEAASAPEPRRSKRLSGEATEQQEQQKTSNSEEPRRGRAKERPPDARVDKAAKTPQQDQDDGLRVERKRKGTKIALPFADTPVIQRNKEMRQTSSENQRRSSSTMRGRRASSLIDSGTSNAVPHSTVDTSEFYKHISQAIPEPRRMMLLLTWCGSRALTERAPGDNSEDVNAGLAARAIQDELLKDFTNKSEMSEWYSREEEVKPAVLVKKPNPRNQQNALKLVELEAEVERLERERSQWDSLLASLSFHTGIDSAVAGQEAPLDVQQLDSDQAQIATLLTSPHSTTSAKARARLKEASTALEFKIDSFADGVHKMTVLDEVARESADQVMEEASKALQQRDDLELARSGSSKEGVGDILRAFSRTAR